MPFYPFLGRVPLQRKKGYPDSNLSTGGPSSHGQNPLARVASPGRSQECCPSPESAQGGAAAGGAGGTDRPPGGGKAQGA